MSVFIWKNAKWLQRHIGLDCGQLADDFAAGCTLPCHPFSHLPGSSKDAIPGPAGVPARAPHDTGGASHTSERRIHRHDHLSVCGQSVSPDTLVSLARLCSDSAAVSLANGVLAGEGIRW